MQSRHDDGRDALRHSRHLLHFHLHRPRGKKHIDGLRGVPEESGDLVFLGAVGDRGLEGSPLGGVCEELMVGCCCCWFVGRFPAVIGGGGFSGGRRV